ncbi:hypothetical protein SGRA_0041 [Saprospira grandis str. Lewin]|uniref:Uncharacterized protein n=1 Tax=Saprospira grandis (strain Lewin) TaxID=984262 RepID=H6L4A7_SAPGL|nr:hypothetical protein SGRA_0041 [Saprospira grandis str. Lewin]
MLGDLFWPKVANSKGKAGPKFKSFLIFCNFGPFGGHFCGLQARRAAG